MGYRWQTAKIAGQVMRGNYSGFTKHVKKMGTLELDKELDRLLAATPNPSNTAMIERMIHILTDEWLERHGKD